MLPAVVSGDGVVVDASALIVTPVRIVDFARYSAFE